MHVANSFRIRRTELDLQAITPISLGQMVGVLAERHLLRLEHWERINKQISQQAVR
jgi:hypothetical protein